MIVELEPSGNDLQEIESLDLGIHPIDANNFEQEKVFAARGGEGDVSSRQDRNVVSLRSVCYNCVKVHRAVYDVYCLFWQLIRRKVLDKKIKYQTKDDFH